MSNHIKAKFLGFTYAPVPKEKFTSLLSQLEDSLRVKLPRYNATDVNDITVNIIDNNVDAQQRSNGKELHMVDADGKYGVKVGNNGIAISVSGYVSYPELIAFSKWVIETVVKTINITHFSRLSLRNINLFQEQAEKSNVFSDIRNAKDWGRQELPTLNDGFACSGAATRHEYFSTDYCKHLQLISAVVMGKQSYIPQDEWSIWQLRGGIPTVENVELLVDIASTSFRAPMNIPEKQHNVTEYSWDSVESELNSLHDIVNQVYSDITKDD